MNAAKDKVMSVRLNGDLHQRLKMRLASEGTNFQAKVEELLSAYLDGPEVNSPEISRQVSLAKDLMQRYAPAMRELAR
jgi:plasmid stability protein